MKSEQVMVQEVNEGGEKKSFRPRRLKTTITGTMTMIKKNPSMDHLIDRALEIRTKILPRFD